MRIGGRLRQDTASDRAQHLVRKVTVTTDQIFPSPLTGIIANRKWLAERDPKGIDPRLMRKCARSLVCQTGKSRTPGLRAGLALDRRYVANTHQQKHTRSPLCRVGEGVGLLMASVAHRGGARPGNDGKLIPIKLTSTNLMGSTRSKLGGLELPTPLSFVSCPESPCPRYWTYSSRLGLTCTSPSSPP